MSRTEFDYDIDTENTNGTQPAAEEHQNCVIEEEQERFNDATDDDKRGEQGHVEDNDAGEKEEEGNKNFKDDKEQGGQNVENNDVNEIEEVKFWEIRKYKPNYSNPNDVIVISEDEEIEDSVDNNASEKLKEKNQKAGREQERENLGKSNVKEVEDEDVKFWQIQKRFKPNYHNEKDDMIIISDDD